MYINVFNYKLVINAIICAAMHYKQINTPEKLYILCTHINDCLIKSNIITIEDIE
jgi:hypothetical protein